MFQEQEDTPLTHYCSKREYKRQYRYILLTMSAEITERGEPFM
jgi:hypothetical protein